MNVATEGGRDRLRGLIEKVIRTYEPRFKSVRVELLENVEAFDRTLRFRVDGMLHAEPAPEPVVFDSALEPSTGSFEVKGVE
jgi:type VI secretion system protein ImpF